MRKKSRKPASRAASGQRAGGAPRSPQTTAAAARPRGKKTAPGRAARPNPRAWTVPAVLKLTVMAAAALFLGFNLLFTVPSSTPSLFKGYVTVYYRGARPLSEVVSFLQAQSEIDAVVSSATAEVLYTNFSELERVPLAQLESRFDPLDPRLDDYLKQVGRYFSVEDGGTAWNVFFVATRRNPLYVSLLLGRFEGAGPSDFFICELGRTDATIVVTVIGALFFLLLMRLLRRPVFHVLLAVGVLPWLYALARGGIGDFLLFFFIAAYWAHFLREYLEFSENEQIYGWKDTDKRSLLLRLGLYAGLIVFTFVFTSLYKSDLLEITLALFGQIGLLAGHWGVLRVVRLLRDRKHIVLFRGFKPLTILRLLTPPQPIPLKKRFEAHAVIALLCLLPLALLWEPSTRAASVPLPEPRVPEEGITLAAIRRLDAQKAPAALPDLADFVRHAAYQERLAFEERPAYALPSVDEQIVLSAYRLDVETLKIEQTPKTFILFNDQWLESLSARAGQSSIERMLFLQGRCLSVSFRRAGPGDFFIRDNWTIVFIWSIVLIPLLLLQYTSVAQFVYGRRKHAIKIMRKKR